MSDKRKLPPGSDPDATISGPIVRPKDDPDATVSGPLVRPKDDPDATVSGPLVRTKDDPDQTVSGPLAAPKDDPEATLSGPLIRDPEQTITARDVALVRGPGKAAEKAPPASKADDPDATFSGPLAQFDPDATISSPGGSRRRNPFAPKALPEALQANLAALGGLNQLIAYANPVFSAVPQITAARSHPDPALLKETLQDLIEAFEAGAGKSGASDATIEGAVYALCCLADDAATSTPWGKDWAEHGLLKQMRDETRGGEEFFSLLGEMQKKPDENADLLEFLYICLALGFQGRYRNANGDGASSAELDRVRGDLHALITRRRGRPSGLSERWRPAQAMSAGGAKDESESFAWRKLAAPVFALLVLFVGYKISQRVTDSRVEAPPTPVATAPSASGSLTTAPTPTAPTPTAPTPTAPTTTAPTTTAPTVTAAPAPSVPPPSSPAATTRQVLEKELAAELKSGVIRIDGDARVALSLADDRQFPSGDAEPAASVKAIAERVAVALERTTGPILVRGYADSVPVRPSAGISNVELSAARGKAVAELLMAKLSRPQRVASEGAGDADPIAPNDTEENRAKNRRILIIVGAGK